MKCFLLRGKYMISCTAVDEGYIPSMFELDEYCRKAAHKMCPIYRQAEKDGKVVIIMTETEKMPRNVPCTHEIESVKLG